MIPLVVAVVTNISYGANILLIHTNILKIFLVYTIVQFELEF